MRLTLRTLLAYLDDTLESRKIKEIGQKVAESDAAQELIAKIRQVTRRRRLTTPPNAGPGESFDANKVAEYFESELSTDQLTEIEKICLESDVHLAEVAAVHQILTLVREELDRPTFIAPAAKQRMYDLIHGRKQPRAVRPAPVETTASSSRKSRSADVHDTDESLLLGLPLFRQAPWLRWALPVAAAVLLLTFGVVVWKVLSDATQPRDNAENRQVKAPEDTNKQTPQETKRKDATERKATAKGGDKKKVDPVDDDQKNTGGNNGMGDDDKTKKPDDKEPVKVEKKGVTFPDEPAPVKADTAREAVGTLVSKNALLLEQVVPPDDVKWRLVKPDANVLSGTKLISLPGYHSEVRLNGGVQLTLWGNVPEHYAFDGGSLYESAVTLHKNDAFDLELTLERGRIYVTNEKPDKPALVRIRFWSSSTKRDEVWDFLLQEPGTEVGLELLSQYRGDRNFRKGDAPDTKVGVFVLKGEIDMKSEYETKGMIGPNNWRTWRNRANGLGPWDKFPELATTHWSKTPKMTQEVKAATQEFHDSLRKNEDKPINSLLANLDSNDRYRRLFTIRAFGAMGDAGRLIDVMGESDKDTSPRYYERIEAIYGLRHWLSRGPEQYKILYDSDKRTGVLAGANSTNYTDAQAAAIILLLNYFSPEEREDAATYDLLLHYLVDEKLAIREMAFLHLQGLVPWAKIAYYADSPADRRRKAYDEWRALIPKGEVPRPPKRAP